MKQRSGSRTRSGARTHCKSVQVSAVDLPGVGLGWSAAGGATLRDLGVEDKKKVAKLINQVRPGGSAVHAAGLSWACTRARMHLPDQSICVLQTRAACLVCAQTVVHALVVTCRPKHASTVHCSREQGVAVTQDILNNDLRVCSKPV